MRGVFAALVLGAIACGGSSGSGPREPSSPADRAAAGGNSSTAPAPDAKLTADECGAMIDHIVDIGWAEQKRTLPPDKVPTPDQIAEIKKMTKQQGTEQCLGLPRAKYDCAMAAQQPAAVVACEETAP